MGTALNYIIGIGSVIYIITITPGWLLILITIIIIAIYFTMNSSKEDCKNGDVYDCYHQGNIYKKDGDYHEAVKYYRRACEGDVAEAYNALGIMYDEGKGVKQNYKKALNLFGKACDKGCQIGCDNYATRKKEGW